MRSHRVATAGLVFLLAAVGCTDEPDDGVGVAAPTTSTGTTTIECDFVEDLGVDIGPLGDIACGELEVPIQEGGSATTALRYVVLRATATEDADEAVLYFEGGPGGEAVSALTDLDATFRDLRRTRDVIVYDQRGIGVSDPLTCSLDEPDPDAEAEEVAIDDPAQALADLADDPSIEWARACGEELTDAGVDLSAYDTAANARDANALIGALGYDSYDLVGISYGTRLALAVLRDFPDAPVRSAVLDSAYPFGVQANEGDVRALENVVLRLVADCEADATCAAQYPDLGNRIASLYAATPEETGLSEDELADTLAGLTEAFTVLTEVPEAAALIPAMVAEIEQGESGIAEALIAGELPEPSSDSIVSGEGLLDEETDTGGENNLVYTAVQCREEIPLNSWEDVLGERNQAAIPGLSDATVDGLAYEFATCRVWPAAPSPEADLAPSTSAVPTLVLAGAYDATTPAEWGRLAADQLENATFVEFPTLGHAVIAISRCANRVATAFVENPDQPLDTSCVEALRPAFE